MKPKKWEWSCQVARSATEAMWMDSVWVFNGGGNVPAAVFTTRDLAEAWIALHGLTGVLTKYPLDVGVYEWAIDCGAFKPKRPDQSAPHFIERFSPRPWSITTTRQTTAALKSVAAGRLFDAV